MFPKIINLTLRLVIKEIDDILEQPPQQLYRVAFSNQNQELRQQLISHILSQTPNYYAIVEEAQDLPDDPRFMYNSLEECRQLQNLISDSIIDIYQENVDSNQKYMSLQNRRNTNRYQ